MQHFHQEETASPNEEEVKINNYTVEENHTLCIERWEEAEKTSTMRSKHGADPASAALQHLLAPQPSGSSVLERKVTCILSIKQATYQLHQPCSESGRMKPPPLPVDTGKHWVAVQEEQGTAALSGKAIKEPGGPQSRPSSHQQGSIPQDLSPVSVHPSTDPHMVSKEPELGSIQRVQSGAKELERTKAQAQCPLRSQRWKKLAVSRPTPQLRCWGWEKAPGKASQGNHILLVPQDTNCVASSLPHVLSSSTHTHWNLGSCGGPSWGCLGQAGPSSAVTALTVNVCTKSVRKRET